MAWDNMTYGQMVDSVLGRKGEWPAEVVKALKHSVATRNYLAHKFLREFFVVRESQDAYGKASGQLVQWSTELEALEDGLRTKIEDMGGTDGLGDLPENLKTEIVAMRPTDWPI